MTLLSSTVSAHHKPLVQDVLSHVLFNFKEEPTTTVVIKKQALSIIKASAHLDYHSEKNAALNNLSQRFESTDNITNISLCSLILSITSFLVKWTNPDCVDNKSCENKSLQLNLFTFFSAIAGAAGLYYSVQQRKSLNLERKQISASTKKIEEIVNAWNTLKTAANTILIEPEVAEEEKEAWKNKVQGFIKSVESLNLQPKEDTKLTEEVIKEMTKLEITNRKQTQHSGPDSTPTGVSKPEEYRQTSCQENVSNSFEKTLVHTTELTNDSNSSQLDDNHPRGSHSRTNSSSSDNITFDLFGDD